MSAREAQKLADEAGLDLVKIAPKAKPPVVRLSITVSTNTSSKKRKGGKEETESHRCEGSPPFTKH